MKFSGSKIYTTSQQHSINVQNALFGLGYKWTSGDTLAIDNFQHSPVIFLNHDGLLSHSDRAYADMFFVETPSVTVEQLERAAGINQTSLDSGEDDAVVPALPALKIGINPKQGVGSMQLSPTLVSPLTVAHVSLAKLNGYGKYGGANFIGTNVTMTTYLDAMQRHLDKIRMGEEFDEVDGVSHWGAIGAGIDIILCARSAGTLVDDRLRCDGQLEAYKELTPMVKKLKELHETKTPHHYLMVNKEADNAA